MLVAEPRAELDAARADSGQCSMSCAVTLARRTSVLCQNCSSTAYAGVGGKQGKFVGLSWLCSLLASVCIMARRW